ncbi:unnamed protein product, partial [Rotaria sp. Silwood2]
MYAYSSSTNTMPNHKCLIFSNKNQLKIERISSVKSNSCTTSSDTNNPVNCKTVEKRKYLITSIISDW